MRQSRLIRSASIVALTAVLVGGLLTPATPADVRMAKAVPQPAPVAPLGAQVAGSDNTSRFVALGVGKSVVIDLPRDVKDVLVADPKIANAVVRSSRRAYMIGVTVGQTNVFFFDADGQQIAGFDIAVTRDLNGVRAALKQALPEADIHIEGVGDGVVLTGSAASPGESQQAFDLAARLAGSDTKVVNGLSIRGRDQVMLKVTVAEVQRDVIKQLGVDLNGSIGYGTALLNFNNTNPFSATGQALSSSAITPNFGNTTNPLGLNPDQLIPRLSATVRAMERAGVIRTLAEPNLTAISGETASFLAGGEFPYPVPPKNVGDPPGFDFKKFGVSLTFTPVVLSEGRISLKVLTEVSELSGDGGLTILGTTIPSLKVRRADTTVEIPSGGSLALAGLIQEQTKQQINGLPGLMQVPVLGALFKSRDFVNHQTELMVLITPYIVRAVAQKNLSRPDDGFADPSDPTAVLLGRLNRIYGIPGRVDPNQVYHGSPGFDLN
jgi:pilus assembly protein CpaC